MIYITSNIWTEMAPLILLVSNKKRRVFHRVELWVQFQSYLLCLSFRYKYEVFL
jgi:hypothetical protein